MAPYRPLDALNSIICQPIYSRFSARQSSLEALWDKVVKDFFISYTRDDRPWAEWVAWQLESAGYSCVIQAWDFRAGTDFVQQMEDGLRHSERILAIATPEYFKSRFTTAEWHSAFTADPTGSLQKLIPIRVRDCALPELLKQRIYIDLAGISDERAAKDLLLQSLSLERAKPSIPPLFPEQRHPAFPRALPAVCNLPFWRNPLYLGREDTMSEIRDRLAESGIAILCGVPGVGKTSAAMEYAFAQGGRYRVIWWIDASRSWLVHNGLAELAKAGAGLGPDTGDRAEVFNRCLRWLQDTADWLLIFDNASDADAISFITVLCDGQRHAVVTSRNPAWSKVGSSQRLAPLRPEDAQTFLLRRTNSAERSAASELGRELGFLPQALEQAGAFIEASGCSIAHYLQRFSKRRSSYTAFDSDDERNITAAWQVTTREVAFIDPMACTFLFIFSFFEPTNIPVGILRSSGGDTIGWQGRLLIRAIRWLGRKSGVLDEAHASMAPAASDPDQSIALLIRYGLIEPSPGDTISIHPLLQHVMRTKRRWLVRRHTALAVQIAGTLLEFPQANGLEQLYWFSHALSAAEHAHELGIASPGLFDLLLRLSEMLDFLGEVKRRRATLDRAFQIAQSVDDNHRLRKALLYRAHAALDEKMYPGATTCLRELYELEVSLAGNTRHDCSSLLAAFARLFSETERHAWAREYIGAAIHVRTVTSQAVSPDLAALHARILRRGAIRGGPLKCSPKPRHRSRTCSAFITQPSVTTRSNSVWRCAIAATMRRPKVNSSRQDSSSNKQWDRQHRS